jgi:hypothetical protein
MANVRAQRAVPYAKKIVLHCENGYKMRLDALVEDFIRDGVVFVGVVGKDCSRVEDIIDELVVGDGSRDYHLLTSSHPDASIEEAVQFAKSLTLEFQGHEVQVVEL